MSDDTQNTDTEAAQQDAENDIAETVAEEGKSVV